MLCDALARLADDDGESCYLRLSTRPIDQTPFGDAVDRHGEEELRSQVLAGGYRLIESSDTEGPGVTIVTTGAMAPEAISAAAELADEGVDSAVINLTSPDRAYRNWQARYRRAVGSANATLGPCHLDSLIPAHERGRPVISVHDAASHSLAWIGSAIGSRQVALGVDRFGESGTIRDLHEITGISAANIVNAALLALA